MMKYNFLDGEDALRVSRAVIWLTVYHPLDISGVSLSRYRTEFCILNEEERIRRNIEKETRIIITSRK